MRYLATGHWRHLFTNDDQPNDEGYLDLDLDKTAVAGDYVAYGAVQTFDVKGDMELGGTTVNVINAGTGVAGISSHDISDGVLTVGHRGVGSITWTARTASLRTHR